MTYKPKGRRAGRVVRHVLKDGSVKVYEYAPHRPAPRGAPAPDCLTACIEAYRRSPEWRALAPSTQQNYAIYLRELEKVGHVRAGDVRRRDILLARDAIAAARGNGAATGFIRAASALFGWAVDREWIEYSPVNRIKKLDSGELRAWTWQEAETALAGLPEHLRRVVVLALFSGARRSDLIAMRWADYDGSRLRFVPIKTRKVSPDALVIPVHPTLKAELDAWKADKVVGQTILLDGHGKPWKPTLLSQYLPAALVRLGLSNELGIHGVRKLTAALLAEAGATTKQIASVTGHHTLAMIELYTRSAQRAEMARSAIERLSERIYKQKNSQGNQ